MKNKQSLENMPDDERFEVINLNKKFYRKPNLYLDKWAKHCGWKASLVFDSLCRHADKNKKSFPSIRLMAKEHNLSGRTIRRGIKALEKWNIIHKKQKRSKGGKFLHNTYYILKIENWKNPADSLTTQAGGLKSQKPTDSRVHIRKQMRAIQIHYLKIMQASLQNMVTKKSTSS